MIGSQIKSALNQWDKVVAAMPCVPLVNPIIEIKDGLLGNLATIAFMFGLAALAIWLDHRAHGEVSIVIWGAAALFVLFCYIPIDSIRHPKSRTLFIDGNQLVWSIRDKEGEASVQNRLALSSIRALKWIVPTPAGSRRGQDYTNAPLLFITAEGASHTLPSEFFPAAHRRKIEEAFKQRLPNIQIIEKLESPD